MKGKYRELRWFLSFLGVKIRIGVDFSPFLQRANTFFIIITSE